VEVLGDGEHQGLVLWNALNFVTPFARNLDRSLDCLCTSIHWQDHVKSKELGSIFGEAGEYIVIEGTTT
jgi:hypothetical protein